MTAWSAEVAGQLARELRDADRRATDGPWEPGSGWLAGSVVNGRVGTAPDENGRVIVSANPNFAGSDDLIAITILRNNARYVVGQLEAAAEHIAGEQQRIADACAQVAAVAARALEVREARIAALESDLAIARWIVPNAIAWRDAQCDSPSDCGDGMTYHSYDCPTEATKRALVDAIDANRGSP